METQRRTITRLEARMIADEVWKIMRREMPEPPEQYLTAGQAAEYINRSKYYIYHNIKRIPHIRHQGRYLFTRRSLAEWIDSSMRDVT